MKKGYVKIGKLDKKILEDNFLFIAEEEVIFTFERYKHVERKHKEDLELYQSRLKEIIEKPDYIIQDIKYNNTIMMIKKMEKENINVNVIVRLILEKDIKKRKNSIMTFYRVRNKNLKKLIKRNKIIYKRK